MERSVIDLKRVRREAAINYAFEHAKPQLRVAQGEWFVLEVRDLSNGGIKSTTNLFDVATPGKRLTHGFVNPFAGPIVEGAEPGDTLVVDVNHVGSESIGFVATEGNMGPLLYGTRYPELQHHFTQMVEHRPGPSGTTSDGTAHPGNLDSTDVEKAIGSTTRSRTRVSCCTPAMSRAVKPQSSPAPPTSSRPRPR
jgi:amidase